MKTFDKTPTTVIISGGGGDDGDEDVVWIGESALYYKDAGFAAPYTLEIRVNGEVKHIGLSELKREVPGEVGAVSWPNEYDVQIRQSMPSDAVAAVTIASTIPLPLEVISTMVSASEGTPVDTTLHALAHDDGFVGTMLLVAPTGLYARFDSAWHALGDGDEIDGLNVYDVEDSALVLYDEHDSVGRTVHITSMPILESDQPRVPLVNVQPAAVTTTPEVLDTDGAGEAPAEPEAAATDGEPFDTDSLFASGIRRAEDLPAAITAAASNTSLRWYVEKRARALGYKEKFPWE